jgi:hypothetical protein
MRPILMGAMGAVLGASAVLLLLPPREPLTPPPTSSPASQVSRPASPLNPNLEAEVATLRRELAELRAHVASLSSAGVNPGALEGPVPAVVRLEAHEPEPAPDIAEVMEEKLHTERPDAALEASLRRDLEEALAPLGGGIRVKDVLCSTAMCRAELVHEAGPSPRELSMRLAFHPAFQRQTYVEPDFTVSPPRSRVFLARGSPEVPPQERNSP